MTGRGHSTQLDQRALLPWPSLPWLQPLDHSHPHPWAGSEQHGGEDAAAEKYVWQGAGVICRVSRLEAKCGDVGEVQSWVGRVGLEPWVRDR